MTSDPTRLCLLGGVGLLCSDEPVTGRIARRHPLAVLAVLAAERAVPVTRDRLAALLWPESDERRARRRLRVTLHALRKALGAATVVSVGDALHLNEQALVCDLWVFEDALSAGMLEQAAAQYRGAFLDGFHLSGRGEFEKWTTRRRDALAQRYREALDRLAEDAQSRGDAAAVVKWLRLRVAEDPYNEHTASLLLDALEEHGEREAALNHAEEYERRVREDLGVDPGGRLAEQKARLRRAVAESGAAQAYDALVPTPIPEGLPSPPDQGVPSDRGAETVPPERVRSRSRAAGAAVVAALAFLAVAWLASTRTRGAADPTGGFGGSVAVLPFAYSGSDQLAYLSSGMVDLLSTKLDGIAGLRAVDPNVLRDRVERPLDHRMGLEEARAVAERSRASAFVLGSVMEAGGQLTLEATLYGIRGEALGRASEQGAETEILALLDRLTLDLLADQLALTHSEVAGIAATTTRSVPALRAYLEAERLVREQRLDAASERFRAAIAEDSTFALAYYQLAVVESFRFVLGPRERGHILDLAQEALEYSDRLTWRDREVLRGFEAFRRFDAAAAEAHLGAVLDEDPDDVEALYQLGETLLHTNPRRGRSPTEAGPLFERAVSLQPDHVFALRHLVDVALMSRDTLAVDTLAGRLEALSPETAAPYRFLDRWMAAMPADRALLLAGPTDLATLQRSAELLAHTMRALADARQVLREVIERTEDPAGAGWYTGPGRAPARAVAYDFLAHLDGAAGRRALASAHLDSAEIVGGPGRHLGGRLALAFWPFLDVPRERTAELLRASLQLLAYDGPHVDTARVVTSEAQSRFTAFMVAHMAARAGDTARYEEALAVLDDIGAIADSVFPAEFGIYSPTSLERAARAYPAFLEGRWRDVVEILQAPGPRTLPEENRWMLARALDELDRDQEALAWYGSFDQEMDGPRGKLMPPYAPAHYYRGRIREDQGEAELAASHFVRFLEVWTEPDPNLVPMVEDARRRLAELEGRSTAEP